MKKILLLFIAVLLCFGCFACGNKKQEITYTNLTTKESLQELKQLLTDSGVKEENADRVVSSVSDYNNTIGTELLTEQGTIDLEHPIPTYDDLKIDENWSRKNDMFIGYNCRITAYELMKDFLAVSNTASSNPTALFMDQDALNNSPVPYFTSEELGSFETMYSTIETNSSTDVSEQYEIQKKYWESIGITFDDNQKISLISVYIHNHFSDTENELIVGHTGVLMSVEDGYVFFEKLSFQLPYQMIHFNTKDEVKTYLMAAYDTDTTGESAKPFILENDKLL